LWVFFVLDLFSFFPHNDTIIRKERKEVNFVVEVKRRKGESFESLLRRYSRRLQQSGNALEARKLRHYTAKPTKNMLKTSAVRRMEIQAKRAYLTRIGQLVEEPRGKRRR